ncbi:translesion error-prone DNA polymerase V autoproteolytic subunit [Microvirga makkahensis]|uniref:LexA family protein n=1 Tax=Microvirga makkahensis TaxID=1128670 RepID=UPI0031B57630
MLTQISGSGTVRVPLYGHVLCAGFPSPAQDYIEEQVELPRWMAPNPAFTFLFKVGGYSMIKARIFPGDLLIVDRSITPANRHVVVVDIDGERSVKRLMIKGGRVRFAFENDEFPPFQMSEHSEYLIFGVVLSTYRRMYEAWT